ncbi:MAG: replicative DNA helicase [Bacteroidota bacterium]|jgi:replicative DNA helicase
MENKNTNENINETGKAAPKRGRARVTPSEEMHGRIPPQAPDVEEVVLGALLLDSKAINAVIDFLKAEAFYKDAHQRIYSAIQRLFGESEPIDLVTVTNELRKSGELEVVGGPYYLAMLTNRVASSANIEYHARIIAEKYIQRELIRVSTDIIRDAYEDTTDVFDLLDKAEQNLFSISEETFRRDYAKMDALVAQAIEDIRKAREFEGHLTGVPSGFTYLDQITGGWQKTDLIVVAARPGMGKTAFILSMARNIAIDHKRPVAIFSLEMGAKQLVTRLISSEAGLPADKLRTGNLADYEMEQLNVKITPLIKAPIYIDDTPALSIFELRAKCRRLKEKYDIQLAMIDYIQLMTTGGDNKGNREQEIATISRSLKSLAKELNIPVIILSQLNRSVETRGGAKKPQLSDLRESGAIEQDADIVLFIYRPEYYKIESDENGPTTNKAYIMIAKHRNGKTGDIRLKFIAQYARFMDDDEMGGGSEYYYPGASQSGSTVTIPSRMNSELPPEPPDSLPF